MGGFSFLGVIVEESKKDRKPGKDRTSSERRSKRSAMDKS
jgi:hypothetical protein